MPIDSHFAQLQHIPAYLGMLYEMLPHVPANSMGHGVLLLLIVNVSYHNYFIVLYLMIYPTVINCNNPPTMNEVGLSVQFTSTFLNAQATYSCASGYNLSGTALRTCGTTGQWSGDTPQCIRMYIKQINVFHCYFIL